MVCGAFSDDRLIQLKVVTGTLNAQKYQNEILESGVRSTLDSLDGQNMVLRDDTVLIEEYKNQQNIASLLRPSLMPDLFNLFQNVVVKARLTCLKLGTNRIKPIVNFAGLYCMSGTEFHFLNVCTQ